MIHNYSFLYKLFFQITTYGDSPLDSITRDKMTICEVIRGKLRAGEEELFENEYLQLPTSLPMTSLPGCSLIDVDYVVEVKGMSNKVLALFNICLVLF